MTRILFFLFLPILIDFSLPAMARADNDYLPPFRLESPRDTVRTFMEAMNDYKKGLKKGDEDLTRRIADAVRCLNLGDVPLVLRRDQGREKAILLKEVIDRILVVDYEKIPAGAASMIVKSDLLPRYRLDDTDIVIEKVDTGERAGEFLFSAETVYRVDDSYNKVKHLPYLRGSGGGAFYQEPWLESVLPQWAKDKLVLFPTWKWVALFLAIFLGYLVKLLGEKLVGLAFRISEFFEWHWRQSIVRALRGPLGLILACGFWFLAIYMIRFEGRSLSILTGIVQVILCFGIVWSLFRMAGVITESLRKFTVRTEFPIDPQLIPLLERVLRIVIVVFGLLVAFETLGLNVASIMAGLGLGGLAFALAAKDSVANVFGSIMILIDRPFRAGDWILTQGFEGIVEEIGFRSTRIRTFYDSVVAIPNQVLANANIDNMGRRTCRRLKTELAISYANSPGQIDAFIEAVQDSVSKNPIVKRDEVYVMLEKLVDDKVVVTLICYLMVLDSKSEYDERQVILADIIKKAQALKIRWAYEDKKTEFKGRLRGWSCRKTAVFNHRLDSDKLSGVICVRQKAE